MGLVVPGHVGSFQIKEQTRVSCLGRWILTAEPPGKSPHSPLKVRPFAKPGIPNVTIFSPGQRLKPSPHQSSPDPQENPQNFYEEFRILTRAYHMGLLDLCQFIQMNQDVVMPPNGWLKPNGKIPKLMIKTYIQTVVCYRWPKRH